MKIETQTLLPKFQTLVYDFEKHQNRVWKGTRGSTKINLHFTNQNITVAELIFLLGLTDTCDTSLN
jgi:hypothetical protein